MLNILCAKCKNAYLQKRDDGFVCPNCENTMPLADENLLTGIGLYNEGNIDKADDYLMKYIVKEGAEPRAIFYKALCDASRYNEQTVSLTDTYEKLCQSLAEIDGSCFADYLATANDELTKTEKAIIESHIRMLVEADAEEIKKQVSIIIALQNDAVEFRKKLASITDDYNNNAEAKLTVRFSDCYYVNAEIATEVGDLKFDKITENIASHTVFTGILSTNIKNLEIYYRCIVMFFGKNREKYNFLMASAEKFIQLAKILEEGNYNSIKGTATIGDRLKAAAYDFFQESLKDEDDEEEQQTQTVVVHEPETLEIEATPVDAEQPEETELADNEEIEFEDIYSSTDITETPTNADSVADYEDISSNSDAEENAEEVIENEPAEEAAVNDGVVTEPEEIELSEEEQDPEADAPADDEPVAQTTDDNTAEEAEDIAADETQEVPAAEETVVFDTVEVSEAAEENEDTASTKAINLPESAIVEEKQPEAPAAPTASREITKRKKSLAPLIAILVIGIIIIGTVFVKILSPQMQQDKYAQATQLAEDGNYLAAAELFEELKDYEDSKTQASECKFQYAATLEKDKKYTEAAEVYATLGEYSNSDEKVTYCVYSNALLLLDSGKFDEAVKIFETIPDYKDSADQIKECTYQKALKKIEDGDYVNAVTALESLGRYKSSSQKTLEAKLAYVKANMDPENETTLIYVNDLVDAKYPNDIESIRKMLLNSTGSSDEEPSAEQADATEAEADVTEANVSSKKIKSYINYSTTDKKTSLKEAESGKTIYFHVDVNDAEMYGKKYKISYKTSLNYELPASTITFSKNSNTFELPYTGDSSKNYTVEFSLVDENGKTVVAETIKIK